MHTTKVSDTHDPAACDLEIYDQPPTQCEDLRPKGSRESTEAGSREVEVQEAGSGEADVQDQVRCVRDPKLIFDMYKVQHVLSRNGIKKTSSHSGSGFNNDHPKIVMCSAIPRAPFFNVGGSAAYARPCTKMVVFKSRPRTSTCNNNIEEGGAGASIFKHPLSWGGRY